MTTRLLVGDVSERMRELPDHSFDLIVTSPPFLALRSYLPDDHPQKHLEIGLEATPAEYLDVLLALSAEWRRLLAPHGSLAVELGDTYAGSGGAGGDYNEDGLREGQPKFRQVASWTDGKWSGDGQATRTNGSGRGLGWPLDKSLTGIPTLYAWSLAYGRNLLTGAESPAGRWRIRNLKPWIRSNPPVGALGDKERPATSYVTVACVSDRRWFDLDAVRTTVSAIEWAKAGQASGESYQGGDGGYNHGRVREPHPGGAPPLDWWHPVDALIDTIIDQPTTLSGDDCELEDCIAVARHGYSGGSAGDALRHIERRLHKVLADRRTAETVIDREIDNRAGKANGGKERTGQGPGSKITTGRKPGTGSDANPGALRNTEGSFTVGARGVHVRRALENAGLLQRGDFYDVSPRGYSGAHYAVWPPELVRLLIDEMCPRRVCVECGEPSRRITEAAGDYARHLGKRAGGFDNEKRSAGQPKGGHITSAEYVTAGWSDCGCPGDHWRPGRIFDPFSGSGTTLAVASGMGRDSVGIDLDPRNADLTLERVGMFLEVDYGTKEATA